MKRTATLYLAQAGDGDILVFNRKPRAFRQREREYNWDRDRDYIVTRVRGLSHWDAVTTTEQETVRPLLGRNIPKNKIVKVKLSVNPVEGTVDRIVTAAPTEVGVGLFKKTPTLTNQHRWNPMTQSYEDLPTADGSDAQFCTSGWEKGTGISIPSDKAVKLGITIEDISDIPLRKQIAE